MDVDTGSTWARVRNSRTGEGGWLNLQTEEVFTDETMRSLITASESGAVAGDPVNSSEWISAEVDAYDALGVGDE